MQTAYDATDKDDNPIIPENSHVHLAAPVNNDGAQILRRPFSYNDGADPTAERWPPWRQEMEFDAGLLFICFQRDPRTGFIKIFEKMAKFDMMNQFVMHTGGGLFACPGGVAKADSLANACSSRFEIVHVLMARFIRSRLACRPSERMNR
jgi:deferrochelatase/peroxidase EfeB